MAKLVKYAVVGGQSLDKAMCEFCGRVYGSVKEARKCEQIHCEAMLEATQEQYSSTWEEIAKAFENLER